MKRHRTIVKSLGHKTVALAGCRQERKAKNEERRESLRQAFLGLVNDETSRVIHNAREVSDTGVTNVEDAVASELSRVKKEHGLKFALEVASMVRYRLGSRIVSDRTISYIGKTS